MTSDRPDPPAPTADEAKFAAAWRAASREEPPATVDAAVRAAARRAAAAGPRPANVPEAARPERWWWPLAAAATIGAITIGILQVIGPDAGRGAPAGGPAVVSDMPAERSAASETAVQVKPRVVTITPPTIAPSAVAPRTQPPVVVAPPAPPVDSAAAPPAKALSPTELPAAPRAAPAPSPPSAAPVPAPPRDATAMRDQVAEPFPAGSAAPMAKRAAEPSAAPAPARQGAALSAGAAKAERSSARAPLSVPDWIALIRRLRADGKDEEAAKEIAAFRAAHPGLDPERLLAEDAGTERPAER